MHGDQTIKLANICGARTRKVWRLTSSVLSMNDNSSSGRFLISSSIRGPFTMTIHWSSRATLKTDPWNYSGNMGDFDEDICGCAAVPSSTIAPTFSYPSLRIFLLLSV